MKLSVFFAALVMCLTAEVRAQAFFGGGVVAFNPQVSTVSSGTVVDVQPTVSYDRKYVTLNMRVQDSNLLSLAQFQFSGNPGAQPAQLPAVAPAQPGGGGGGVQAAGVAQGFVGNVNFGSAAAQMPSSSPDEIDRRAIAARSVLSQRGMFLLRVN